MKNIKTNKLKTLLIACAFALPAIGWSQSDDLPSREEMWRMIQQQQKQIEALTKAQGLTEKKIEITADRIEQAGSSSHGGSHSSHGHGGAGWFERTQIGGYGELHYNMGRKDEIDLHRWVLFFGHDFTDKIRMVSELEIEHAVAGEGQNGEVEMEQAYIEFDINDHLRTKAGVFLMPIGILNETHEPNTFYGVERNPIENKIIPATWWESGLALSGNSSAGFGWDIALHSGLNVDTSGSKAFNIRIGRQKSSEAEATDGAVTGRLKWTAIPGVELAVSGQYQQDIAQGTLSETADATLVTVHADIERGGFGLRALYGRWDINSSTAKALDKDEQYGFYLEPSYKFGTDLGDFGFFARYNQYDEAVGGADTKVQQVDLGTNYWPHPNVVLKADVQFVEQAGSANDEEIINLGVGYQF
jgi:hypothetical protein